MLTFNADVFTHWPDPHMVCTHILGYFFACGLRSAISHLMTWKGLQYSFVYKSVPGSVCVFLLIPAVPSSLPQRVFSSYDSALASVFQPQTTNWVDRIWQRQKRNHLPSLCESAWEGDKCKTIHPASEVAFIYLDSSKSNTHNVIYHGLHAWY